MYISTCILNAQRSTCYAQQDFGVILIMLCLYVPASHIKYSAKLASGPNDIKVISYWKYIKNISLSWKWIRPSTNIFNFLMLNLIHQTHYVLTNYFVSCVEFVLSTVTWYFCSRLFLHHDLWCHMFWHETRDILPGTQFMDLFSYFSVSIFVSVILPKYEMLKCISYWRYTPLHYLTQVGDIKLSHNLWRHKSSRETSDILPDIAR